MTGAPEQTEPGRGLLALAYFLSAGITATGIGAWASAGFSGSLRAVVWIGVTAVLAVAAAFATDAVVNHLGACWRAVRGSSTRPVNPVAGEREDRERD